MAAAEPFDICVIGPGAGGGVMIQELARAGFSVVALGRSARPFVSRYGTHGMTRPNPGILDSEDACLS